MWTTPDHSAPPPAAGPDGLARQASEPVGDRTVEDPIYRPDMLMIGAFARNSGKTELACRIISRLADEVPIVGLKVTTVEGTDGRCPHGDTGCGVCSSHAEPWALSRELDRDSAKDTGRLLASGASEVYWLRVLRSEMVGGAADLLTRIPPGWLSVCESNSLREVVEPGLFLQVRASGADSGKRSAREVAHLTDEVVVSDGRSFDLDLDRISVIDGQWAIRREACAVVIHDASGRDKAVLTSILQQTLTSLEPQFDRVVVEPQIPRGLDRRDALSACADLRHEWCFMTPPMAGGVAPGIVNAMFRRRPDSDVVVAVNRTGGPDASLALCRRRLLPDVVAALGLGRGAVAALGDRCAVRELSPRPAPSGAGFEPLPAPATAQRVPAPDPASRGGAETP